MKYFQGTIVSRDEGGTVTESKNYHGAKAIQLRSAYNVLTNSDNYHINFIDKIVDTENPDNIGLYMLKITKQDEKDGIVPNSAGIYYPPIKVN